MNWWEWTLIGLGSDLAGAVATFAVASNEMGKVPATKISEYGSFVRNDKEKEKYENWEFVRNVAPAWPLFCVVGVLYLIVKEGIYDGLMSLTQSLEGSAKKNTERRLEAGRQVRYDQLWDKRDALPFGVPLGQAESREMQALAAVVGSRPDTRTKPTQDHFLYPIEQYGGGTVIRCACPRSFQGEFGTHGLTLVKMHLTTAMGRDETYVVHPEVLTALKEKIDFDPETHEVPRPYGTNSVRTAK